MTRTDPVAVKVVTRTDGSEEDILDVEEPLADSRLPGWVSVLLGIVAAALLVFLGWFLHKKFRREKEVPKLLLTKKLYFRSRNCAENSCSRWETRLSSTQR